MRTLSGRLTGKYTAKVTCTHTHTSPHTCSLLILLAKVHMLLTALAKWHIQRREREGELRGRLSTNHLETSGSTISISLPLINFPCFLIFLLHPVLYLMLLSNNKSFLCSASLLLIFLLLFYCTKRPLFLQFGSNGSKYRSTHAHKCNKKTQISTHGLM